MKTLVLSAAFVLLSAVGCESQTMETQSEPATDTVQESGSMQIIGGVEAGAKEFTFLAALVRAQGSGNNFYDQFCGGTLVHPQYVLTASHCVEGLVSTDLQILLGTNKLNKKSGQRYPVAAIYMHPKYNTNTMNNDIALVKLAIPALGYPTLKSGTLGAAGSPMTIAGWGAVDYVYNDDGSIMVDENGVEYQVYPHKLQRGEVEVIDRARCNKPGWLNHEVTDKMFCAGFKAGGVDTCQGDSGGPALRLVNGTYQVVGITSWGYGCAQAKSPGVYTLIETFKPFMKGIVGTDI